MSLREPVVAGTFYPSTKKALLEQIGALSGAEKKAWDAIGVVSPHAGYVYSGGVAASVYGSIKPSDTYVILGPNHTGLGQAFGISTADAWKTPIDNATVDKELAGSIISFSDLISYDDHCHDGEHSIEVQLPFIQSIQKHFKFVPLVVSTSDLDECRQVASAIAQSIIGLDKHPSVTIVASSDMTHYEPQKDAQKKDAVAIKAMLDLDEERLFKEVRELDISMCGLAPCAIMIAASKQLGATKARLVRYATSGESSGDYASVVGYAGIVVS